MPEQIIDTLGKLPKDASTMDVLRSGCSLLAHWDPEAKDNSHEANFRKSERLLAQLPTLLAARHRLKNGQKPVTANSGNSFASNCLQMLLDIDPSDEHVKAMDVSLILYAEHEYNASTFTARVIASTGSDLHSSVVGAIGALKGPLHGGANERVMEVLNEVRTPRNAEPWIRALLERRQRIMGFGHRVYKDGDPRAVYLKKLCRQLADQTKSTELEVIADTIERIMWEEKRLPPNLDWPSARLYHYLGLPIELYTPLFVLSRTAGWCAHIIEQNENNRLIRPRARYIGHEPLPWISLANR